MSHSDDELRWGEDDDEDLKWDSESGAKSTKQSTSWEDLDVEEIENEEEAAAKKKKQQEEEEKRAKEEKKKQREQKEERKKELQEKKKTTPTAETAEGAKKGEVTTTASGKKISNMLQEAMEKTGDFDAAVDLFQGAEKPRIELLNPKTEKEFDEFAFIVADKINEFKNDKTHFVSLLVKLLERTTEHMKYEDFKQVREKADEISKKKQKQKEEEKKQIQLAATKKKKASINVEKNADPFADLSAEHTATTGTKAQFDDDDFM